jgi:hypothetical protein
MTVIGFAALMSSERLRAAGATNIVTSMNEIPKLLGLPRQ